jgi:hypothetical protein
MSIYQPTHVDFLYLHMFNVLLCCRLTEQAHVCLGPFFILKLDLTFHLIILSSALKPNKGRNT